MDKLQTGFAKALNQNIAPLVYKEDAKHQIYSWAWQKFTYSADMVDAGHPDKSINIYRGMCVCVERGDKKSAEAVNKNRCVFRWVLSISQSIGTKLMAGHVWGTWSEEHICHLPWRIRDCKCISARI